MKKFFGFTLMELTVAIMILAVLVAVCFPVIVKQDSRKKAYSYYMAYKTLENISHQLLIMDSAYVSQNDNYNFLVPQAYAAGECSTDLGFYNMTWNSDVRTCVCASGKEPAINNNKVCCPVSSDTSRQYAKSDGSCISCAKDRDYNETTNSCCPKFSYYDGEGNCKCIAGYALSEGSDACGVSSNSTTADKSCPMGYKYSPSVNSGQGGCVLNYILGPDKFCKNIEARLNIDKDTTKVKCNVFTGTNIKSYTAAFNAAIGTDGKYLSRAVKIGAFKDLAPNIILANGLKLWIPQQKTASIPGLSMAPEDIGTDSSRNACYDAVKTRENCFGDNLSWCDKDAKCYGVTNDTLTHLTSSASCCSSPEINWKKITGDADTAKTNDVFAKSGFTVFVDIDGDEGSGTLWDDVFPFYICNDGIVYPGYALGDGTAPDKADLQYSNAGDNPQLLGADVYYYKTNDEHIEQTKPTIAYSNISFARAACLAGNVSIYTPYCLNLSLDFKGMTNYKDEAAPTDDETRELLADKISNAFKSGNPCLQNTCFITVKRKNGLF